MWNRTLRVAGLVLALALVPGCDGATDPVAPLAPEEAVEARGGVGKPRHYEPVRIAGDLDLPSAAVRLWVWPQGGEVELGPFRLSVPNGAVREPTRFTVAFPGTEYLEVDLTAEVIRDGRLERVREFRKPLEFSIGYGVGTVLNPLGLAIAHLPGDSGYDKIEPLPTSVDEARARVKLKHFSRYILVEG